MKTRLADVEGCRIEIRGTVQGVGFRPWVYRVAREMGIGGRIRNDASGVIVEAFAPGAALRAFRDALRTAPPPASVQSLEWKSIRAEEAEGFAIVASTEATARRVSIPPDLATCAECARELADPADRRRGYAFTNCTHCGPRFTIAEDVPYDRGATTMRAFRLCPQCAREYGDPDDRRFHAEPDACPRCGPRLRIVDPHGRELPGDPIDLAATAILSGAIVAVKGVGGYHLACDATSHAAVRVLRDRKRREEKPFAVMVQDLEAARQYAHVGDEEARLLASPQAPIVLVRRRSRSDLTPEIAPRNPLLGLLLPYSPLHHLLLRAVARPLVMTSGNLSEEPIAYRDADALERLCSLADLFLVHDRAIATRCDDSVARIVAGRPVVLRRSRGYVPRAIRLARPVARPILACGAHLKNTFCLAVDDMAVLGPHIGDLEGTDAVRSLAESADRMARFLRVEPEVIAHDLHPAYASTEYALSRAEPAKVAVQHHHAHVASAIAEHGLSGPVIGVAYDGTGYGLDGTAWGGEVLVADAARFERVATIRPVALAGADQAIRQPWRIALALLDDALGGDARLDDLPVFAGIPPEQVRLVRRMIGQHVNAPLAHGVGRIFDGVVALVLGQRRAAYEGQVALEWNLVAGPTERSSYGFDIDRAGTPWTLDLRPMIREILSDVTSGRTPASISGAFHRTMAAATGALVRAVVSARGRMPVVLTGGCFQNALLAEQLLAELAGLDVFLHGEVPPGDGGIALGQAVVADAVLRG